MFRLRSLALDIEPLRRHRDFRLILGGQLINNMGSLMTEVALPYQLYVLTHSALALGALAAVQFGAILLFASFGGTIADAVDRRKLMMRTQAGLCLVSITLLTLAVSGRLQPWHIFGLAFIMAVLSSVDKPARQALVPRLVSAEMLRPAIVLNQLLTQTTKVLGPSIGGLVIAAGGVQAAFGVDVATFGAGLAALASISSVPPAGDAARPGWAAILEGVRFIRQAPAVLSALAIDFDAMVFGMPSALFPILALDVFHVGPQGFGLLAAAPALGGVLGAITSGWTKHVRYQGRVVIWCVVAWGIAITLFGLSPYFPLAVALMALAGAANTVSATLRWTIIQLTVPDGLRGRINALNIMAVSCGPKLGDLEATTVAAATTPQVSVVSGGLLCIAGLAFIWKYFPGLFAYDAHHHLAALAAEEQAPHVPVTAPALA